MATDESLRPHICVICGHVYDPAVSRTGMGIPSGTPFTELPDPWCCPVCNAVKSRFRKVQATARTGPWSGGFCSPGEME